MFGPMFARNAADILITTPESIYLMLTSNAREVLRTGQPKLVSYGIADEEAWEVGLPCGGEIDVFVEPLE